MFQAKVLGQAASPLAALIVVRTVIEDRTLPAELEAYEAYAEAVRFRLFPGIW